MKYRNVSNHLIYAGAALSTFTACAHIENTVIANYDLAADTRSHYELIVSPPANNTTVTLIPLEEKNKTPSTFKISACVTHYFGLSKQGEFHFSGADTDQNDLRLSKLGAFVNEHNLRTWWIHLDAQQNLLFNQDVGGLMVSDPSSLTATRKYCQQD